MIYDLHTHTTLSDGSLSPIELIRRACVAGYRAVGLTDHAALGSLSRFAQELSQDCALARERWGIMAIPGVELTHVPAAAVADVARAAKEAGLWLVVVHGETISEPVEEGTNLAAVSCGDVDILAHPGLISLEEAELAARNGVFLELSARPAHALANGHVARVARMAGAKLIVNTDNHGVDFLSEKQARRIVLASSLDENDLEEILQVNPQLLLDRILARQLQAPR
ncbi:MAG: histidinol phosphate phosphatase domain-containing protein [Dehalococcoidia bacterium]